MGIIKEPLEIDFEVDNRPLTKEEEKMISDFIRLRKEQLNQKSKLKPLTRNKPKKQNV